MEIVAPDNSAKAMSVLMTQNVKSITNVLSMKSVSEEPVS